MSPPIHSHDNSGSTVTPSSTEPAGRPLASCAPEVVPSPPTASKVTYTSRSRFESIAGVPTGWLARPEKVVIAGRRGWPSTVTTNWVCFSREVTSDAKPPKETYCPSTTVRWSLASAPSERVV